MTLIRTRLTRKMNFGAKLLLFIIVFVLAMTITFSEVSGAAF